MDYTLFLLFVFGIVLGFGGAYLWFVRQNIQLQLENDQLKNGEARLQHSFENLVNQTLEVKSKKFDEQVQSTLRPFRVEMSNLKQSVDQSSKERFSLKEQIERIGTQANHLAEALTTRPKMRGNWGEVVLQNMLEDLGMRKDKDYKLQASIKGEDSQRLAPDIILYLPENKHLIIDSKTSLISYEKYIAEKDEPNKKLFLNEFIKATKSHIDGLAGKKYHDSADMRTPDFTLLFMPIEGAYITALTEEQRLFKYGWERKIVIVSPSTLFATLQTVSSLWRLEKQNKNAEEIARQGGRLYDKFHGFLQNINDIGAQLDRAQKSHEKALNQLSTGKDNLIKQADKLKELGARTSKQKPSLDYEQ